MYIVHPICQENISYCIIISKFLINSSTMPYVRSGKRRRFFHIDGHLPSLSANPLLSFYCLWTASDFCNIDGCTYINESMSQERTDYCNIEQLIFLRAMITQFPRNDGNAEWHLGTRETSSIERRTYLAVMSVVVSRAAAVGCKRVAGTPLLLRLDLASRLAGAHR